MKYDAIIFDLDGTLWDTTKAYAYALEKYLINHPKARTEVKKENLQYTIGVTMDQIASLIFPSVSPTQMISIMMECLKYACDYLKEEAPTIFPEVIETIQKLSPEYPLFVISDGPQEFYEIFIERSGLKNHFKDAFVLGGWKSEKVTKKYNLTELVTKYQLKNPLYVGDFQNDFEASKALNLDYCQIGYGNYQVEEYKYYLEKFSEIFEVLKINEILQDATFYQVFSKNKARVVLMENKANPMYQYLFGFWKFSSDEKDNQIVFEQMEKVLRDKKQKNVIGPINYCTWFDYRLPLDHFDLEIYPDLVGNEQMLTFLAKRGYFVFEKYKSTISTIDQKLFEKAKKATLSSDFIVKVVSGQDAYAYVDAIYEVSTEGFEQAFLYTSIKKAVFKKYYLGWFAKINPELVLILTKTDQTLVAFALSYQNPDGKFYVSKTVGIRKAYQHHRLILTLVAKSYELMVQSKIPYVVYHYQSVKKDTLKRLRQNHEILVKYYGLFKKEITE